MKRATPLKILVIRPDRLGDVLLSTPVFEVIKRHYPKSSLSVMVREAVAPLIRGLPHVDEVIVYDPDKRHSGFSGFWLLVKQLVSRKFRIAVHLQSERRLAAAVFFARIRYRVGPLSKVHSFLFFNRGVRQRRSQVEMHETDYNLQLLRRLGIRVGSRRVPVRAHVSEEALAQARAWLESKGWTPGSHLIAIHPGMGGSALNWPESHYIELARALIADGRTVLITGGTLEQSLIARIRESLGPLKSIIYDSSQIEDRPHWGSIQFLGALYTHSAVVVAPSTGPLHLAVAVGKPVVTFYPPIRVQSAIRWGPYVKDESRASILVPDVYCGQDFKCLGNLCNYFPCMRGLTVTMVIEQVHRQLEQLDQIAPEKTTT
jgi:heptosyltransferase-3